ILPTVSIRSAKNEVVYREVFKMIIYIAAYNGSGGQGGVERVVAQQCNILKNLGVKVIILDKTYFKISNKIRNKKIQVALYPILVSLYLTLQKLRGVTFKVIAHGYCSPFYRNDILIAHGNMKCYFQTVMNKKPNRLSGSGLLSFYERWAGAFSKNIWAVSNKVKSEWNELYNINSHKIKVVRNFINLAQFDYTDVNEAEYVTFVGRLEKGKGIDDLYYICKNLPDTSFHLVSSIPAPQNFASLNNVLTSIAVPYAKMPEIFKKSRVLILPSYYEGYELVTIEALCCGCPVIGYNVGAIRELYAESFPGVFIANNKEDLAQVAYKLISLDNEKYYHLRQTIYSKRELFSEERYAEILTAAFNEKK
ncbi:glycosyltransferase family 4 protein, partial [Escherichia coli]